MPKLLTTPFATDANPDMRTDIQNTTGTSPNSATYSVGFPPVTMQPLSSGGLPPKGSDFNGIFYDITDNIVFQTQGNAYPYNAAYATEIGGYPLNARIAIDNGDIVRSTIASNTNNPNTDMTGWVKVNSASQIFDNNGNSIQEVEDSDAFKKTSLEGKTLKEMVPLFSRINMNENEIITTDPVESTSNKHYISDGFTLNQTTQMKSNIISDWDQDNVSIHGFDLIQDKTAPVSGGTANDHHMIRFYGGYRCEAIGNKLNGQYGISFAYRSNAFSNRRGMFGLAAFNISTDIQGMGIENGGSSFNVIVGNRIESSSKGAQMAQRFTAYNSVNDPTQINALTDGVCSAANVYRNFVSGFSFQNATKLSCSSAIHFEEMDSAINSTRGQSAISGDFIPANDAKLHNIQFTSGNCKKIIANLAINHSKFDFTANGSQLTSAGIEELTGRTGTGFNQYSGIIDNATSAGALFRYSHNLYNLQIDTSTGDGAVISGNYGGGTIIANACNTGVSITGSFNNLKVVSTNNVFTGLAVSGASNVVEIQTDGNVSISGNGNTIIGRIGGNLTVTGSDNKFIGEVVGTVSRGSGTGNKYSDLKGWSDTIAMPATTTTGGGRITLTVAKHASAQIRNIIVTIPSNTSLWTWKVVSISGSSVVLEFYDSTGAVLNAQSVTFNYSYFCS